MLKIRADQMDALSNAAVVTFEQRVAAHLRRFFPDACQRLNDAGLLERIRYGISIAATYGIVTECGVCKYIDVMFTLGWQFDCDPQLPWAHEILIDDSVEDSALRVGSLCDAV